MKTKTKFMAIAFTLAAMVFSLNSYGTIVLVLGSGINQGDGGCVVTKNYSGCGTSGAYAEVACVSGGSSSCPSNSDIRGECGGAIVYWISNATLDTEVSNIIAQADAGTTSGSYTKNYHNTGTGESASLNYSWVTSLSGELSITIDEV